MVKKASKTKKQQDHPKEKQQSHVPSSDKGIDTEPEKEADFGGLPRRDLKKNLGCGG